MRMSLCLVVAIQHTMSAKSVKMLEEDLQPNGSFRST